MDTKIFFICVCCVALFSFQTKRVPKKENETPVVDSIKVIKTPFNRMYSIDISCEKLLSGIVDIDSFNVTKQKDRILRDIAKATPSNDISNNDIKAKMTIWYSNGKKDILCIANNLCFSINGVVMYEPDRDIFYGNSCRVGTSPYWL